MGPPPDYGGSRAPRALTPTPATGRWGPCGSRFRFAKAGRLLPRKTCFVGALRLAESLAERGADAEADSEAVAEAGAERTRRRSRRWSWRRSWRPPVPG